MGLKHWFRPSIRMNNFWWSPMVTFNMSASSCRDFYFYSSSKTNSHQPQLHYVFGAVKQTLAYLRTRLSLINAALKMREQADWHYLWLLQTHRPKAGQAGSVSLVHVSRLHFWTIVSCCSLLAERREALSLHVTICSHIMADKKVINTWKVKHIVT